MSLVHCPECLSEVSSSALMCVHCGFPISKSKVLHVAILLKDPQMVADLIQLGADVNTVDENGRTPLMIAESSENQEIIKLLIDAGASPNRPDTPVIEPKPEPILIEVVEDQQLHEQRQSENDLADTSFESGPKTEPILIQLALDELSDQQNESSIDLANTSLEEEPITERILVEAVEKEQLRQQKPILHPDLSATPQITELNSEPAFMAALEDEELLRRKEVDGSRCIQCGGSIKPDETSCQHCKTLIVRRYCSHCSKLIPDHATTCPLCRENVKEHFLYSKLRRVKILMATVAIALGVAYLM